MQQSLSELNRTPGILGGMIISEEGIVIEHRMEYDDDTILVALCASLGIVCKRLNEEVNAGNCKIAIFDTAEKKLFIAPFDSNYLVVVANLKVNVGLIKMKVLNAIRSLQV